MLGGLSLDLHDSAVSKNRRFSRQDSSDKRPFLRHLMVARFDLPSLRSHTYSGKENLQQHNLGDKK